MDQYNYKIQGYDNQLLEIILEPGQSIQAEKGAMTFMDDSVHMTTRLGQNVGVMGAVKRKISGEDLLINEFTNDSNHVSVLALSPQRPSQIVHIDLNTQQPDIICRPDTFLAGDPSVKISISRGAWGPALVGGSHFVMQRLHGEGQVFITGNGAVLARRLRPDQTITADLESIIAFQASITHRARIIKGIRNKFFGGESIIVVTATGPGVVWFQSLSHFKAAESHIKSLIKKESKYFSK